MIGRVHTNAAQVALDLGLASRPLEAAIQKLTRNAGRRLVTSVKRHASGGTGPEVRSGDYRDSWRMEFTSYNAGTAVATVGTDKIQGYRLEYGFNGADSLGRIYSQPPNPHVEPALAEVGAVYVAQVSAAVAGWASGGDWVK